MRTNAIMHFHCSECGSILNLVYPGDAKPPRQPSYSLPLPGEPWPRTEEPTGAAVMYVQAIHIKPCQACIQKKTDPADKLMTAIAELGALAAKS